MADTLADLIDRECAAFEELARREEERLLQALRGGPFWGVGKAPVKPDEIRGLAEFLPRSRRG